MTAVAAEAAVRRFIPPSYGTRAPCHRIGPNVTPTAPYALYAARGGGPGGLTIIAILHVDLLLGLYGAARCGGCCCRPNAWDSASSH